jgi:glycosyltransferase involved in cell wall biosynthesis
LKRIVHYYPGAMGNSGVTFALWSWARAQAASGAEVCVLHAPMDAPGAPASFVSKEPCPGLTQHAVPHRGGHRLLLHPVGLDRFLGRDDLLVLHEGWVPSNVVAARAAQRAGVPYVVMPHGVYDRSWTQYLKPPRRLRNHFERKVLEGAAAVHVFFESEIADIRALAPKASFLTLPMGFEVPEAKWSGGGGYISWIGRLDPYHKGLDVLVRAMAQMPAAERPLLRIRGYDYKGGATELRTLIDSQALGRWITLEGPLAGQEKQRFLQQADGYVHPSRWECLGIALIENLALGVPCLVSSTIHMAPMLARSHAALLAQPRESDMADALGQFAGASRDMARSGRALIENTFNWNRLMPQFHAAVSRIAA